jgi:hypothetical protein
MYFPSGLGIGLEAMSVDKSASVGLCAAVDEIHAESAQQTNIQDILDITLPLVLKAILIYPINAQIADELPACNFSFSPNVDSLRAMSKRSPVLSRISPDKSYRKVAFGGICPEVEIATVR